MKHSLVDRNPLLPAKLDEQFRIKVQQVLRDHAQGIWDAAYGPRWEDLRAPASTIRVGGTGTATEDTDGTLKFAGNADNVIQIVMQMSHSHKEASPIRPHIHLRFKTSASANTRWKLTWDIANVNGDFGAITGDDTITVANPQNVNKHVIASFEEIATTGLTPSFMMLFTLTRLASSDAADNDTNIANLLEMDVHYQSDSKGTVQEYTD